MTVIQLDFLASRYHATPWGRNVNEGAPEWPPSPYRLLRALYDVWQRKCPEIPAKDMEDILASLAVSPPHFTLPSASAGHTRSYLSSNSEDPTDKNLVFDAFVVCPRGWSCYISWPDLVLTDRQQTLLRQLLANLDYLGRSESWVSASVHHGPVSGDWQCLPVDHPAATGEVIPVACVVPPACYMGKRPWLDALTFSTTDLLSTKVSGPPLLRQVRYCLPANSVQLDPPARVRAATPTVQAVLIALDGTVLPLAISTLEVAEQIRVRLMGAHRKRMGDDPSRVSPLFTGKQEGGSKRLDHGHLYILPQSNKNGRIDRILLISRLRSLDPDELAAVRGVRELWQSDGRPSVRCVITWQGSCDDPLVRPLASVVESSTPFVPSRHWRRGRDPEAFLRDEIRRECRNHGIPEPAAVEHQNRLAGLFDVIEYRRNRKEDLPKRGYAFRLSFPEPVPTPFSLGYGSHFGLGQFRAF